MKKLYILIIQIFIFCFWSYPARAYSIGDNGNWLDSCDLCGDDLRWLFLDDLTQPVILIPFILLVIILVLVIWLVKEKRKNKKRVSK